MENSINRFFDLVKLVAERLPILNNLIVELAVIGLLVYGVYKIFTGTRERMVPFANGKISFMADLETELQKMYDSEIHVDIGWLWDGGIDVSIGNDEVTGNVKTVAEVLPWLQREIAAHYPACKYNVERMGGTWEPTFIDLPKS